VAAISWQRYRAIDPDNNLQGAPELVVEIKSTATTPEHFREVAALCLATGSLEFWVVDGEQQTVSVVRGDGRVHLYNSGEAIPLTSFGADELAVSEIFT
jgi:Uma2 family endonuclease